MNYFACPNCSYVFDWSDYNTTGNPETDEECPVCGDRFERDHMVELEDVELFLPHEDC